MDFLALVSGDDEFLIEREVKAFAGGKQVEVIDSTGLKLPRIKAALSPSLFDDPKVVHITKAQSLTVDVLGKLGEVLGLLGSSTCLLLSASSKSSAALKEVQKLGGRTIRTQALKNSRDQVGFLRAEARTYKRRISDEAAQVLLGATDGNLRALAALVVQMDVDAPELFWDEEVVRRFITGTGETSRFAVADAVYEGRVPQALSLLHSALRSGLSPALISSALITGAREVSRAHAVGSTRPADLARELKMPEWKAQKVASRLRTWDAPSTARALALAVATDAAVKGGRSDKVQALHDAVIALSLARH
jgi:DNA polymerase-3 subunit delta